MPFEISAAAYSAVDRFVIATKQFQLRRDDRQACRAHPRWQPLTKAELGRIDRRDRYGYTIYKNMNGTGPLEYYLTDAPYKTRLLPLLNPLNHRPSSLNADTDFSDKNYHELFMEGIVFPRAVVRRIAGQFYSGDRTPIAPEEALALMAPYDELVFKATVESGHGHGIRLASAAEYRDVYLSHGQDYVVQERVRQHPVLAGFNPSSVNVIRVTTLYWRGHVYVLGGIFRAGAPGAFCDHENKGGQTYLTIPLDEEGNILPRALDVDYFHAYDDCRGIPLRGRIPHYDLLKKQAADGHSRYPHYGIIGWDFTVDENENLLCMEFNTKYPGLVGTQCALGPVLARESVDGVPLFRELMDAVK